MFFKKKQPEPAAEKSWWFNYLVEFIDGTREDRIGEVRAIHFSTAVDRAQEMIEDRVECDPSISKAFMFSMNMDEDKEVLR